VEERGGLQLGEHLKPPVEPAIAGWLTATAVAAFLYGSLAKSTGQAFASSSTPRKFTGQRIVGSYLALGCAAALLEVHPARRPEQLAGSHRRGRPEGT
jgi:hypothetical protein